MIPEYVYILWLAVALITGIVALFIAAPYGRHTRGGWGPMISNRLGWIIMETPAILISTTLFFVGDAPKPLVAWIFWGLYVMHYVYRSWIFPFLIRTQGKKMPLSISLSAIGFNLVNAGMLGYFMGFEAGDMYTDDWLYTPQFIGGVLIMLIGLIVNIRSDLRLIRLRKPGETGYKIPQGGLFRFISCPNHFGEIIEWAGFAMLTWSMPGLVFVLWTAANLIPRAIMHHRWYREKFADYPQGRKAVIPFVL